MNCKITGAFTALVTPFDNMGQIDVEGLRKNIQYQIKHSVDGIVVLGTTGEAPTLTHQEKKLIISIAREETDGKCHLSVGTGCYSTQQTIESTLDAYKAGADSALVVTPYYNKPTQEGLYQHYAALAKAVKIPIVIYNVQVRTSQNLQTETLKRLAQIDSIVGVKEASGSVFQMMEVIETILPLRPDFSIMSGDDALTLPLMALGGHGVYSVLGNLFPQQIKKLCNYFFNGDYIQARKLHYELLPYIKNLFLETNPIPVKTAMRQVGLPAGHCRLPLCEMEQSNLEKLKATFANISIN